MKNQRLDVVRGSSGKGLRECLQRSEGRKLVSGSPVVVTGCQVVRGCEEFCGQLFSFLRKEESDCRR